jgi:hypothetical protein
LPAVLPGTLRMLSSNLGNDIESNPLITNSLSYSKLSLIGIILPVDTCNPYCPRIAL